MSLTAERWAQCDRCKDVLGVAEESWVSTDVIRDPRASIVDLEMTQVVDGDLVKVMSWYDNAGLRQPDGQRGQCVGQEHAAGVDQRVIAGQSLRNRVRFSNGPGKGFPGFLRAPW
ncbi:MAG: hypothetical protein ACOYLD_06155 [Anaerohalosphaeraceae bacterium]|jgi:hypothetical protein